MIQAAARSDSSDVKEAQRIDALLKPWYEQCLIETNPIPIKWAMAHLGLIKTGIRLPLMSLDSQYRDKLASTIDGIQHEINQH